jgi:DNA-binding transcriptional ArsR family regulator
MGDTAWLWLLLLAVVFGAVALALFWCPLRAFGQEIRLERARELFKLQRERLEAKFFRAAASEKPRGLRILDLLKHRELCVTEIVETLGEKFTTVSQRLRLLRSEGLIVRRREGNHLYYALADRHVVDLILNALAHATELDAAPAHRPQEGDD